VSGVTEEDVAIARKAMAYVLGRISEDPDARYLFGACTESLRQLCMGYAALSDPPMTAKEVEARVLARPQDFLGDSVWDKLRRLRESGA
jgi:hypothetical protein